MLMLRELRSGFFKGCFTSTITLNVSVWPSGLKSDILKKSHRNHSVRWCQYKLVVLGRDQYTSCITLYTSNNTLPSSNCTRRIFLRTYKPSSAAISSPGHLLHTSLFLDLSHLNTSKRQWVYNLFTRLCLIALTLRAPSIDGIPGIKVWLEISRTVIFGPLN